MYFINENIKYDKKPIRIVYVKKKKKLTIAHFQFTLGIPFQSRGNVSAHI